MPNAQISRGGSFEASFKAAATITSSQKYEPAYLSAAGQVGVATTITNIPVIGTILEASTGGANSSVLVNLFTPTQIGKAGGVIAAGNYIAGNAGVGLIAAVTATALDNYVGIAITAASATSELFEFLPLPGITKIA